MVLNADFNNISAISMAVTFVGGGNWGTWRKPDLPQVTDKLYQIMLYTMPWVGFDLTTLVVTGTDCIGSCATTIRSWPRRPPPIYIYIYIYIYERYPVMSGSLRRLFSNPTLGLGLPLELTAVASIVICWQAHFDLSYNIVKLTA